jgi:hypothetical protein
MTHDIFAVSRALQGLVSHEALLNIRYPEFLGVRQPQESEMPKSAVSLAQLPRPKLNRHHVHLGHVAPPPGL